MEIVIKKCNHCEDYTELYQGAKYIMDGDDYHDKIKEKIEGFIAGLRFLGKDVVVINEDIVCDNCQSDIDYEKENK